MRICPACGRENDYEHDFCECGEYLDWSSGGNGERRTAAIGAPHLEAQAGDQVERDEPPTEPIGTAAGGGGKPPSSRNGGLGPASPEPAVAAAALSVRRLQDDRDSVPLPVEVSVPAGGRSLLMALIRNQSGIVDNYDLAVVGLPESWWTITPRTAYLVPFGRGPGFEQEVEIALHPPRSPQAEARHWPFAVVAVSRASNAQVATAHATVVVEPYWEIASSVQPVHGQGRLGARYQAAVHNRANAPVDVVLRVLDDANELRFEPGHRVVTLPAVRAAFLPGIGRFARRLGIGHELGGAVRGAGEGLRVPHAPSAGTPLLAPEEQAATGAVRKREADVRERGKRSGERMLAEAESDAELTGPGHVVTLAPGERAGVPFVARPERQIIIGRAVNRRFTVSAQTADEQVVAQPRQAVLRQRPLLPWWLLLVVPLIIAAIILYLLLRPKQVTVPHLIGDRSAFVAEQQLQQHGLTLAPNPQTRVSPRVRPGTVIGQTPAAGQKVKKGSSVAILVAIGAAKVKVPKLVGERFSKADQRLANAGLTLGMVSPKPDPKGIVANQVPAAGATVPRGTPVQLFLAGKKKKRAPTVAAPPGPGGANGGGGGANSGGGGGGGIAVPAIEGAGLRAYEQRLSSAGLTAVPSLELNAAKRGTVIATRPKPGTKVGPGTKVAVTASAGSPVLAYDGGVKPRGVDGLSGRPLGEIAPRAKTGTELTFEPGGTRVALSSRGSIMTVPLSGSRGPVIPIASSAPPFTYSHPAFGPRDGVIGFVRAGGTGDALCFSRVEGSGAQPPGCVTAPGWRLGSMTWAADGKSILIAARRAADPQTFGLLKFTTLQAYSSRASQWRTSDALLTPRSPGQGVLAAAISPDGRTLALLANLGSPLFRVMLTTPGDLQLQKAKLLPLFGCELAWRSDSQALALVEGDPTCAQPLGAVFSFSPSNPRALTMLVLQGEYPSWQPLSLSPASVGG